MTNITTGIGTVKLLSDTKCSYRLTVAVTDIVTNSRTGIGTVKLLSGTKCSYRLTDTLHEAMQSAVNTTLLSLAGDRAGVRRRAGKRGSTVREKTSVLCYRNCNYD